MIITGIVLGAIIFLALIAIRIYNQLVSLSNRLKNALAQIDVALVRRLDLIPNLVNTAKGYMKHERETLEAVTQARQAMGNALADFRKNTQSPEAIKALSQSQIQLDTALSGFNVSVEAYPDLKASANMMQLSEELITTENQISFARQAYNDAVLAFNEYKQSFPSVLFAGIFGFKSDALVLDFSDRPERHQAVQVQF